MPYTALLLRLIFENESAIWNPSTHNAVMIEQV